MMPAVDFAGKLILDAPDHIFENPNGHGGVMKALVDSDAAAEMHRRGVTDLFHFQVDNVLTDIAEPVFLGLHNAAGAQMSSKVCRKRDADEKVGVTVQRADGRIACVEYSNLSDEQAHQTDTDGALSYWAGNLCIYWYALAFAELVGSEERLPFHLARKKIPYLDERGEGVSPEEPSGIKFETFVFDALPLAEKTFVMEIDRAEEFAPVKNGTGEDSPDSARQAMTERFARWLEAAGVNVPRDASGAAKYAIEISPIYAASAVELKAKLTQPITVDGPLCLSE
jgi:UDP-N-acetylglucosamine/UDP-N-acetylgalactosamine diphosphorylase